MIDPGKVREMPAAHLPEFPWRPPDLVAQGKPDKLRIATVRLPYRGLLCAQPP